MSGTIKASVIQDGASATANLTFDTSGGVTVGQNLTVTGTTTQTGNLTITGGLVPSSSFLRNRIINGAMVIDQRNSGASVTPTNATYTLDRWKCYQTTASKFSVQQTPNATETGYATRIAAGFTNYAAITSLSSYSVLSSDYYSFQQPIEGFNAADLGWGTSSAKTVTLSFLVQSSLTGTFGGSIFNNAGNRSYPFNYTISSANTWTSVTVTIPGDTTGTWLNTNGVAIQVCFGLGSGSTYSGTAGAWGSSLYLQPTGTVSVVGTNAATWYVTGVQLEVGTVATPFERRLYGNELALCQRYYEVMSIYSSTANSPAFFRVTKRAAPTVTSSSGTASYAGVTPSADGFWQGNTSGQQASFYASAEL